MASDYAFLRLVVAGDESGEVYIQSPPLPDRGKSVFVLPQGSDILIPCLSMGGRVSPYYEKWRSLLLYEVTEDSLPELLARCPEALELPEVARILVKYRRFGSAAGIKWLNETLKSFVTGKAAGFKQIRFAVPTIPLKNSIFIAALEIRSEGRSADPATVKATIVSLQNSGDCPGGRVPKDSSIREIIREYQAYFDAWSGPKSSDTGQMRRILSAFTRVINDDV